MPQSKLQKLILKAVIKEISPRGIRDANAAVRHAQRPQTLISPTSLLGGTMSPHVRAVFDLAAALHRD